MSKLKSAYALPTFASYTRVVADPAVVAYMGMLEEYIRTLHIDLVKLHSEIKDLQERVTNLENP